MRLVRSRSRGQGLGNRLSLYRALFLRTLRSLSQGQLLLHEVYRDEMLALGAGGEGEITARVRILDPEFYRDAVLRGPLGVGEAWIDGTWESDDLEAVIRLMLRNRAVLDRMGTGVSRASRWALRLLDRRNANSIEGSRRNIAAHYDLGNDFFASFLDPSMTYSSAVFEMETDTLEIAQERKLDRVCAKLDLQPEDHLLEIGTGWGSFAIHAATRYGCRVTTTTISQRQFEEASRRIEQAGLADRVEVVQKDYRDLEGQFDKIASIEMVEAVGDEFLEPWFAACSRLLRPNGCMVFQAITIEDQQFRRALKEVDFIKRYIFPGCFIPSSTRLQEAATAATDMRLVHMEDFGQHYAETLRQWRQRLAAHGPSGTELPEAFLRMWNYYLDYCAGGFAEGYLGVAQFLYRKPQALVRPILGDLRARPVRSRQA